MLKLVPRLMHPRSGAGLRVQRGVIGALASPLAKKTVARLSSGKLDTAVLPAYRHPASLENAR